MFELMSKGSARSIAVSCLVLSMAGIGASGCADEPGAVDPPGGDTIWTESTIAVPTTFDGTVILEQGLTVTSELVLLPCTVLKVPAGAAISVRDGGSIRSEGTEACPVTIRSAKAAPSAGDWSYIEIFASASANNVLRHTNVHHAGSTTYGAVWVESLASLTMDHVTIERSKHSGLVAGDGARFGTLSALHAEHVEGYVAELSVEAASKMAGVTAGGNGRNAVLLVNGTLTVPTTLPKLDVPYVAQAQRIEAPLTVAPGTTVLMEPAALWSITDSGALIAKGTEQQRVRFASVKSAPGRGDWEGFDFFGSSSNQNRFEHADIAHVGRANYGAVWVDDGAEVAFQNVRMQSVRESAIQIVAGSTVDTFAQLHFEDVGGYPIVADLPAYTSLSGVTGTDLDTPYLSIVTGALTKPATLHAHPFPYQSDRLHLTAVLTMDAGTELQMRPGTAIELSDNGGLMANGTALKPIEIRSAKSSPAPGDWLYIDVFEGSVLSSKLVHTRIRHAGDASYGAVYLPTGTRITLESVTFQDILTSCDIVDAGGDPVLIDTDAGVCR